MATTHTAQPFQVADRPRGKAARERWYDDHTRPDEALFVVELVGGSLGRMHGRVAVAADDARLAELCARYKVAARCIRRVTFPEGVPVFRA